MGLTKAKIFNTDVKGDQGFTVLFNPTEYTIARSNQLDLKKVKGKNTPTIEFGGGSGGKLSMELLFDGFVLAEEKGRQQGSSNRMSSNQTPVRGGGQYDPVDVRPYIEKLWNLSLIVENDPKVKNQKTKRGRPPRCQFQWGGDWSFIAFLESLSIKYTLFREDGIPIRATATVSFQQGEEAKPTKKQNPTSYSEPGFKRRAVEPRDTLAMIAFDEYGDPNQWRKIAEANGLDDPMDLRPGQILAIPPI